MAGRTNWRTIERWIRIVHRWTSILFVGAVGALFITPDAGAVAVVLLIVMLATGVEMLVSWYLTKFRRRRSPTRTRTSARVGAGS